MYINENTELIITKKRITIQRKYQKYYNKHICYNYGLIRVYGIKIWLFLNLLRGYDRISYEEFNIFYLNSLVFKE